MKYHEFCVALDRLCRPSELSALRCICVVGLRRVRPAEANQVNLVNYVSSTEALGGKMDFETP